MNTSEINHLIDRFENSSIREMSINEGNFHLYLSKNESNLRGAIQNVGVPNWNIPNTGAANFGIGSSAIENVNTVNSGTGNAHTENMTAQDKMTETQESKGVDLDTDDKQIKSPIVGTFYRAASPEEKPFVMIGQPFKKGDVIGIIEAMKMMNEIRATEDGEVTKILAQDGEMVEFDQTILCYK